MKPKQYFLVIDAESAGLHGEKFAVAGGLYESNGHCIEEFEYSCPLSSISNWNNEDLQWVLDNCPKLEPTHENPAQVREAFWQKWTEIKGKYPSVVMAADCPHPVESSFISKCIADDMENRKWSGPYPFLDIASVIFAAGKDSIADYPRDESELPKHHPLKDARQSARIFFEAIKQLHINDC